MGFSDEAKETVLPEQSFSGVIRNCKFTPKGDISLGIQLEGNEGITKVAIDKDGNTEESTEPVDGSFVNYTLLTPREAHKSELTKTGMTKYQWRINNIARDLKNLALTEDIDDADALNEAVADQAFVGIDVSFKVKHDEYNGSWSAKITFNGLSKRSD